MTALAARARLPEHNGSSLASFFAALLMHAALVASMWFAVQWRTSATAPAVAELWELPPLVEEHAPAPDAPAIAAPAPAEETTPPAPEIVQKQEAPHRPKAAPRREVPPAKDKHRRNSAEPSAEDLIQQEVQSEEAHRVEMNRLASQAGMPAPNNASASPSASGPLSNEYAARIRAAVRAHLSFAVPEGVPTSLYAEFVVELLATGELASEPRLVKPSGLPGYDEAARRATLRTDPFPRRDDGTVPPSLTLQLYPQDTR